MIVHSATRQRRQAHASAPHDRDGARNAAPVGARRYNHLFILWVESSTGSQALALALGCARALPRRRSSIRRFSRCRDHRPPAGRAWSRAAGVAMLLYAATTRRSGRSPAASCCTTSAARAARRSCGERFAGASRARAGVAAALRRHGGADPVAAAAAGAVQDFRAAGRRRRHQRRAVSPRPSRSAAASAISAMGVLAVWYGDQAQAYHAARTAPSSRWSSVGRRWRPGSALYPAVAQSATPGKADRIWTARP